MWEIHLSTEFPMVLTYAIGPPPSHPLDLDPPTWVRDGYQKTVPRLGRAGLGQQGNRPTSQQPQALPRHLPTCAELAFTFHPCACMYGYVLRIGTCVSTFTMPNQSATPHSCLVSRSIEAAMLHTNTQKMLLLNKLAPCSDMTCYPLRS